MSEALATGVPAEAVVAALRAAGVTHVVIVPDTHQRTVLAELARQSQIRVITACTEDEAIAINARMREQIRAKRAVLDSFLAELEFKAAHYAILAVELGLDQPLSATAADR